MERPRTERQVRLWLEKKLKTEPIADELWERLEDLGYVDNLLSGEDSTGDELLSEARALLRIAKAQSRRRPLARGNPVARAMRGLLTAEESERTRVFSLHVGRIASEEAGVLSIRESVSNGRLLSSAEALGLLKSPAPYLLSRSDFTELGIPMIGHSTEVKLKPSVGEEGRLEWSQAARLRVLAGRRSVTRQFTLRRFAVGERHLVLPDWVGGGCSELPVRPGTLADDLMKASGMLHDFYPWEERDALWFILTGEAPWILPLQVGIRARRSKDRFEHVVMDFSVEPWVSAGTLMRVFRACQREALGPKRNRGLGLKNLALLDFVGHYRAGGAKRNYPGLTRAWNARFPEWSMPDYRHFQRAYLNTRSRVLWPGYPSAAVARAFTTLRAGNRAAARRKPR